MITRQEMFDRAVRGLRSQGFERAAVSSGMGTRCVYQTKSGHRCAWGWVDRSLTNESGRVDTLHIRKVGLAATLEEWDVSWALSLQEAHDVSKSPADMERTLRNFAITYELVFPEE